MINFLQKHMKNENIIQKENRLPSKISINKLDVNGRLKQKRKLRYRYQLIAKVLKILL